MRHIKTALFYIILTIGAASMIFPFLWMILTSVKPEAEIFAKTITFHNILPSHWLWSNYVKAMQAAPFGRYFFNTVVVSVGGTAIMLVVSSMAAYAFARLRFPGRQWLFLTLLATMMIPAQVTMIPSFIILRHIPLFGGNNLMGSGGHGWLNNFLGLIVPGAAGAFGIFMLRQFFQTLPREMEDAGRIDGATESTIFWRIIMPLSKPALAALGTFAFTSRWNDFMGPLLIMSDDSMKTLQIGLQVFQSQYTAQWDLLMAGTVLVTLPVILVFLFGQRYFVSGITMGGVKG
ncbi:MAG TPA: carbohydrate ABC transporter permease [Armatimonadota bacterium]|jgi:multiple sugar transport system permease protein